jgi:hypothetical protein
MHWRIAHYSDEATMCVVVAITHDFAQENVWGALDMVSKIQWYAN